MWVVPRGATVAQVEGEWHIDAVERDVQVGIYSVRQLRASVIAHRRVVIGVLRTYSARDDERVALHNLVDALGRGPSEPEQ